MKISACVIVKNEENNLPRWLEIMKEVADEIIVVDTGSTDKTRTIAKAAGIRFFQFPWNEDFAAAKNFAIEQASGDWILFPDADEFFLETTLHLIPVYLLQYHESNFDAFLCKIINIDSDQNSRILQISHGIRIFRKTSTLRFTGRIHEQLVDISKELQIGVSNELELIHTGYSKRVAKEKAQRNLEILKKIVFEHGMQPEYDRYFCDCYEQLDDAVQAEACARRYLNSGVQAYGENRDVYKKWLELLIRLDQKSFDDITAVMDTVIAKFPSDPAFVFVKGKYCALKNQNKVAKQLLLKALDMERQIFLKQERPFDGLLFEYDRPETYHLLGKIFFQERQQVRAQLYFEQALRLCPHDTNYFLSLFALAESKGKCEILKKFLFFYDRKRETDRSFLAQVLEDCGLPVVQRCLHLFLEENI